MSSELTEINTKKNSLYLDVMNGILSGSSERQTEKNVEITHCPERKIYEYNQRKSYKIPENIYTSWPKFYTIEVDETDKALVTLTFRNNPNLENIKNLLHKADADFNLESFNGLRNTNFHLLTIKTNTDKALIFLLQKYNEFSVEATSQLWEVYRSVVEHNMDLKTPKWKTILSLSIDAWEDEENFSEEQRCYEQSSSNFIKTKTYLDLLDEDECSIKSIYKELEQNDKQKFKYAIFNHYIFNEAVSLADFVINQNQHINPFEHSLNNYYKCNNFINNNFHLYSEYVDSLQDKVEKIFITKFEPTFFEKMTDEKKWDKHLKSVNSLSKSSLSIVDKVILMGQYSKSLSKFGILFDGATIISSLFYFKKEFYNTEKESISIPEIDEKILGKNLITIDFICSKNYYPIFDEESIDKLFNFYADFSKFKLDSDPYIALEQNPAFYLLQNITDIEYLKTTEFYTKAVNIILKSKYEQFSLASFLENKNLPQCIDYVNNILSGNSLEVLTITNDDNQPICNDLVNSLITKNDSSNKIEKEQNIEPEPIFYIKDKEAIHKEDETIEVFSNYTSTANTSQIEDCGYYYTFYGECTSPNI